MIPEPEKWYHIRYSKKTSKRGFHGVAQCLRPAGLKTQNVSNDVTTWLFRTADQPVSQNEFACMRFVAKDIVREAQLNEIPPTYDKLVSMLDNLYDAWSECYEFGDDPVRFKDYACEARNALMILGLQ